MISNPVYKVETYTNEYYNLWNSFVERTNSTTFLFHRDFMQYHASRFQDFSLLVFKNDVLISILPANKVDDKVYSHQGLTYGGLFTYKEITKEELKSAIKIVVSFLRQSEINAIVIKEIPRIYSKDRGVIWDILKENNYAQEISSQKLLCVDYQDFKIHKTKLKHYRRALKNGLEIRLENSFSSFWNDVLIPRLKNRYNATPVHTLGEIEYLYSLFPKNILQYNAYLDEQIVAGITIFDKGDVVKSQYGATTDLGEETYAMDFLFVHLVNLFKERRKCFFSMGTVTDSSDLGYNPGLLKQKMEFGCKEFSFQYFEIKLND